MTSWKDQVSFYSLLTWELITLPWGYMREWFRKLFSMQVKEPQVRHRRKVVNQVCFVNIHEWGGYPLVRRKKVSVIPEFECGLKFQLQRFHTLRSTGKVEVCVTLSDAHKCKDKDYIRSQVDYFKAVTNAGMDFSGYAAFYDFIKDRPNAYVILTNSSVNSLQENFLDSYILYLEKHPEVGILGVSYSTKCSQSLISNNFTPHLQSFFLMTTVDVLQEIVTLNKGRFPGIGITHKLLLIRKGEIKLSGLALKLGYHLAVVLEKGQVFRFCKKGFHYSKWNLPLGDMRLSVRFPNRINPIKEKLN